MNTGSLYQAVAGCASKDLPASPLPPQAYKLALLLPDSRGRAHIVSSGLLTSLPRAFHYSQNPPVIEPVLDIQGPYLNQPV